MNHNRDDENKADGIDNNDEVQIIEAKHRTPTERKHSGNRNPKKQKKDIYDIMDICKEFCKKYKQQIGVAIVFVILIILIAVGVKSCGKEDTKTKDNPKKTTQESKETGETGETGSAEGETSENETEPETAPPLSIAPESGDSDIAQLISAFYNAYVISGDMNEVGKYVDSVTGIDENRLSINKKYIEAISDFQCYKSSLDIIDEKYTVMLVTYKIKLYNYEERLPSIDILFLVNGDAGYRVHNLTVDDAFDRQKVENDNDFQILKNQVMTELQGLLAANAQLNEVYNLYLNPTTAAE